MLIEKEIKRINKLIGGSKVYFDPTYFKGNINIIKLTSLLTDKTLVYTNKNILKFPKQEFLSFINEGIILPVTIDENSIDKDILNTGKVIIRKKLFHNGIFDKYYKTAIEEDKDDGDFKKLIENQFKCNKTNQEKLLNNLSFSINWDIPFTQIFNCPLLANVSYKKIWEFKINKLDPSIYHPLRLRYIQDVSKFLSEINILLPNNLTIDQIKEFRRDKASIQFRNWLEKNLFSATELTYDKIELNKYLIQRFNELSKSYDGSKNLISTSIGGCLGGITGWDIGGLTGAGIGSPLGSVVGYSLSNAVKNIWKKVGTNRWVFLFMDYKISASVK